MKMTSHLKSQFDSSNCALLPNDVKDGVLADYQIMSHLGIDNDEDQNRFFMVLNHVPEIAHLIFNVDLNDKAARFVAAEVFKNREKAPISSLLELIEAIALALKKMAPDSIKPKTAYPQPPPRQQLPAYDIARWVSATRKIYNLMAKGHSKDQAKVHVLDGWLQREIMDYEQWLRFYTEKGPEKYPKLASEMDEMRLGGVPVNMLRAVAPFRSGREYMPKGPPGLPQNLPHSSHDTSDVRDKIETQRKKIISRLNSAERLLSGPDGHIFAGHDLELMLKLLQDLKRRVQTANKLTVNSTLFEDFIFRAANQLKFQGRNEAAGFFYKVAQLPPLGSGGLGSPVGVPGGLGAGGEGEEKPSTGIGNKQETHDLLKEFFDNLKRGINDKDDTPEEREELKNQPAPEVTTPAPAAETPPPEGEEVEAAEAAIEVDDLIKIGNGYWHPLISIGQVAPPTPPIEERPTPPPPTQEPSPEVVGEGAPTEQSDDNTDDVIEAALKNVSINDVINRLEMLVSIYNQREISRQLSILDIMMDRIGLSSYFPQLGEAMSKALEANQYIGNRLSEILTKVKGSVEAPGATEWIEVRPEGHPETDVIRQRLEQKDQQDERRKEMRKEKELAKIEGRPEAQTPAAAPIGDAADLQRPSRVEKAPRLDVR